MLVLLGVAVTAYQIFVLGIPVTEDETDDLWNIDAKVEFVASTKDPVKVQMFVPPLNRDYVSLNESFISNNYGVSVNRADGNRKVTWSARRASGNQTLYYRLVLTKRYSNEKTTVKGPTFRDSLAVEGPEKIAAEALMAPIRQHSADVETFVSETIKRVNNLNDDNVKLLLAGDTSALKKAQVIDLLLSIAHVPMEKVHTIRLVADTPQTPELWLRSFNGTDWLYFNPDTGEQGLPSDRLLWWTGDDNLITVDGGKKANVTFSMNNSEMNAIRLAKLTDENTDADFLEYSLYGLPLQTQQTFMIMVMIPIGVLVILVLRNLVGLQTLGTFTPVLDRPGLPRDPAGLRYRAVHGNHRPGPVAALVPGTPEAADAATPVGGTDLRRGADCRHQPVQPQAGPGARAVGCAVPDGDPDHDHRAPVDHLGRAWRRPCHEGCHRHPVRRFPGAPVDDGAGAGVLRVHLPGRAVDPGGLHAGNGSLPRLPPDRARALQGIPEEG
ncbi:hypothetical protein PPS11_33270 [Pseudomonas putida S11]|nr:hypothetical protein PPS11_33270 [Pseudomonas putida S11]